jgi:hypothetical protein
VVKLLQNLMFWRKGEEVEPAAPSPEGGVHDAERPRSAEEIELDATLDSKGTPRTQSGRADDWRHDHEKRGEEPPNY